MPHLTACEMPLSAALEPPYSPVFAAIPRLRGCLGQPSPTTTLNALFAPAPSKSGEALDRVSERPFFGSPSENASIPPILARLIPVNPGKSRQRSL